MKVKKSQLFRGCTSITASLLAALIGGMSIANVNEAFINTRLGTSNYRYVNDSGESNSTYFKSEFSSLADLVEAKDNLAVEIASEGATLLKNENGALPLAAGSEVTLWGLNSHNPTLGGMIGSSVSVADDQPVYDIETSLTMQGFKLNQTMIDLYSSDAAKAYARTNGHSLQPSFGPIYESPSGYAVGEANPDIYTDSVLSSADNTAAIVVLSRDSSEAADYEVDMTNLTDGDTYERPLALSDYEKAMIELAKKHSTKVIVMINASNPIEIEDLKNDSEIDSILWVGEPGVNGFWGVAKVLDGTVNPSGHIVDTFAVNSASSPAMNNFGVYNYTNNSSSGASDAMSKDNKSDWYIVENEGIYTGYKYYETRYEDSVLGQGNAGSNAGSSNGMAWDYDNEVTYPFGYGISYTTFTQTLDSVNVVIGGTSTASVTVKNTGDVAGKSVVQLYVQAPYTSGGIEKSAIQFVGYGKTSILEPGASETVVVDFDAQYFASYDETATKADGTTGAWSLEAGDYYFAVGNGAHEALNNVLAEKTGDNSLRTSKAVAWKLGTTDIETYSVGVYNRLQDMDINNLIAGTVEYTTRSDWSKGWNTVEAITPTEEMMKGLNNNIYELTANGDGVQWGVDSGVTILDAMIVDENGNCIGVKDIDDEIWTQLLDQMTLDEAIQFIEKGGDDVENIDSILLGRTYANDGPLGFTYDQVGGYYIRWNASNSDEETYVSESDEYADYSMNTMPTAPVVAATFNKELEAKEGELFAEDALWANESSLFAPGINIHRTPYCARNHEYYSEDPVLTSTTAVNVCVTAEAKGLQMEPKHFAFNHQESNRSGLSTFINEQAARETELRCFQELMSKNVCSGIMTAFNRAGTTYVGAYEPLLVGIARDEWGYTGWYNTDMINGADYMNWRDITAGGGGNCLTTSAYDTSKIGTMAASKNAIAQDTYFQNMMKYNIKFWLYNLAKSNSMNGIDKNTKIERVLTWWQSLIYAFIVIFAVLTLLFIFLMIRADNKAKLSAEYEDKKEKKKE
jgi:beta-glucosidase